MAFCTERFLAELHAIRFGRAVRVLEETTSTIDVAWEWLHADGPEGGVVIAERQTRGRGRAGRTWTSPEGGLWMSVLARPGIGAEHVGRLGVALALATAEGVRAVTGCKGGVKWPNDVVLEGRKLAGVLGEAEIEGGRIVRAVLSVGLNVNLRQEALPEEVRGTATTLLEATGREHALEPLAVRVLDRLEQLWPSVMGDGIQLVAEWQERDILFGREVAVEIGDETVRREDLGIDCEGALRLLVGGKERRVTVGEIGRLRGADCWPARTRDEDSQIPLG